MSFFTTNKQLRKIQQTAQAALDELKGNISALEREKGLMLAILNSMVEGVIAVDRDMRVFSVNPPVEKIFGITKEESEGKFLLEVIRNNDIAEVISACLGRGEFLSREMSLVWPVKKIFQVNATPIFEKGLVSGCLLVIHDVTEIRKLETVRRDFVANVSHELKTPLTSIKGFIETLLGGALDDKKNNRHFLEIIQNHTERMNSLVNDLLELSQIESKEIKLEINELNLKELCEKVLSGFKVEIKKKEIKVENDLSEGLPVKADKDKIEQVFTNLIDNAIKFNKEKGLIKVYSEESGERIKITIEDSGIGIPPKDIPRIFERFYRVDKARSRELGGTGLGLSIVKHIIELHGGSVGVESTEDLGSKFYFFLPK